MNSAKPRASLQLRVGADIGGTFTDLVFLRSDGQYSVRKVSTTMDDFSKGIVDGLTAFLSDEELTPDFVSEIVHGTTIATNAILENKGVRTALVTTKGFRDVLEFRRLRFPDLFSLDYTPPKPLVPRRRRFGVDERMMHDGSVRRPLDETSLDCVLNDLEEAKPDAIAICLLHSYANPDHEQRVTEAVRDRFPDIYVSASIDVLPEIREYERTSTTVINSYIGPIVDSYLKSMRLRLDSENVRVPISIMQSNGGVMSYAAARRTPSRIIESGPAAGVVEAHQLSKRLGLKDVITFDMGGTTAKASLIEDGERNLTTEHEVGAGIQLSSRLVKGRGHALKLPVIDIAEVGAGGGSIVRIDPGGALRVGPESAGADPGPACYRQGGTDATVTDANVVLGYINPTAIAGGTVDVDLEAAREALDRSAAKQLGIDTTDAAYGVYAVANTTMIRAIKSVTTFRGRDPRDFTLMAFGGSGPVHAALIARSLGIRQIIVPGSPGVFSALGLLEALPEYGFSRTLIADPAQVSADVIIDAFDQLESSSLERLKDEALNEAITGSWSRTADLRYRGQAYELTVTADTGPNDDLLGMIVERFHQEHERTYGRRASDEPVDLITIRSTYRIDAERIVPESVNIPQEQQQPRQAYFGREQGWMLTPVITREELTRSFRSGPLIVEEYDSTTLIPPGTDARIDEQGNITMINTDLDANRD
ncbi:MAG TPA: hydantoinase/oxoprolinase family protein [Dehalococcoidia bacterium]|nr:hydantoinase/oxoprolinase family protein [Dehalococcoidia bacterium]